MINPVNALRCTSAALLLSLLLAGCHFGARPEPVAGESPPAKVVDPDVDRREVRYARIDSEHFSVGAFSGVLSVEDLGAAPMGGGRVGYLVSEDLFLEAHYLRGTVSDAIRRDIGQPFFPKQYMDLDQTGLVLGWNFLPGEVFFGRQRAMSSQTYLLGGVGNTSFNDEDYLTYHVGFGVRVLPLDWLTARFEARDSMWQSDLLGEEKLTHNFEMTIGLDLIF